MIMPLPVKVGETVEKMTAGMDALFRHFLTQRTQDVDPTYPSGRDNPQYTLRVFIRSFTKPRTDPFDEDLTWYHPLPYSWLGVLEKKLAEVEAEGTTIGRGNPMTSARDLRELIGLLRESLGLLKSLTT